MAIRCNVGGADRAARAVSGTALALGAIFAPVRRSRRIAMGVLGAIALGTAATRYCPMNQALGYSSCAHRH